MMNRFIIGLLIALLGGFIIGFFPLGNVLYNYGLAALWGLFVYYAQNGWFDE